MQENRLQLNEAFNGAYKDLSPHIKQALAQSKFAKNFSKHGIDQNSKPVFTKVNSETELNKQLRQLQKEHGQIPALIVEVLGAKNTIVYNGKTRSQKKFGPGSDNPIFIFAIKNGYEQATLATKGNINKYSRHATNVTHADYKTDLDYTTGNKVSESTSWVGNPYDFLEAILSNASGANLYAFVGAEKSIAQQRADNMDFVDKYAPIKSSRSNEPGPSKFMQSIGHRGELRKQYKQVKKEKELASIASSGKAVKFTSISTMADLKALYDACINKATSSIQIGDVWVQPENGSFKYALHLYNISVATILSGEEYEIARVDYSKTPVDITSDGYSFKSLGFRMKLNGDRLVLITKMS